MSEKLGEIALQKNELYAAAYQSAQHLLKCFELDDMDVTDTIQLFVACCLEHKERLAHIQIVHYCRTRNHPLPERYLEIAADNEAYDYYYLRLCRYLIELSEEQNA